MHFADRLITAWQEKKTPLCVGLDPRWESLPAALRFTQLPTLDAMAQAEWFIEARLKFQPSCGERKAG